MIIRAAPVAAGVIAPSVIFASTQYSPLELVDDVVEQTGPCSGGYVIPILNWSLLKITRLKLSHGVEHLDQKQCNRLPSSYEPFHMETALLRPRGRQA